jgi:hypothetical protein
LEFSWKCATGPTLGSVQYDPDKKMDYIPHRDILNELQCEKLPTKMSG